MGPLKVQMVCEGVSCWKLRLPCPCDPYGHCQWSCQNWSLYRLLSTLPLSASHERGGEERGREREWGRKRRRMLFICCLFFFYPPPPIPCDHSSEWPRNVTVLRGAEWTPDSAMEASDFLWKRQARNTGALMEWDVKCCSTVAVS